MALRKVESSPKNKYSETKDTGGYVGSSSDGYNAYRKAVERQNRRSGRTDVRRSADQIKPPRKKRFRPEVEPPHVEKGKKIKPPKENVFKKSSLVEWIRENWAVVGVVIAIVYWAVK